MIKVKSLELENVIVFDKIKFDFKYPISVIRGKNLDRLAKNSSNAVGKSLLFATLPNLLYFTPPQSVKKNSAKELLASKEARVTLSFFNKGKHVVSQYVKGKNSIKYEVSKNGTSLDFRKIDDAKKYISSVFPISEDAFYTFCYLSPRDFHVLLRGKQDTRFDFFENLFELGIFDVLLRKINLKFNELKQKEAKVSILKTELDKIASQKEEIPNIAQQLKTLKLEIDRISTKLIRNHEERTHLVAYLTLSQDIDTSKPLSVLYENYNKLKDKVYQLKLKYDQTIEQEEQFRIYSKNAKIIDTLREKIIEIEATLPKVDTKYLEKIDQLRNKIEQVEEFLEAQADKKDKMKPLVAEVKALNLTDKQKEIIKQKPEKKWQELLSSHTYKLREDQVLYNTVVQITAEDKNSTCPTCQQVISVKYKNELLASLKVRKKENQKHIEKHSLYVAYVKLQAQIDEIEAEILSKEELVRHQIKLKNLQNLQDKLIDYREKNYKLQDLQVRLQELQKDTLRVDMPEKSSKSLLAAIDKLTKSAVNLKNLIIQRKKFEKLEKTYDCPQTAQLLLDKTIKFINTYSPKIDEIQNQYSNLLVTFEKNKMLDGQLAEITETISNISEELKDISIYAALKEAYSSKGLRILQIKNLANMYCDRMNQFARLLFSEPIRFFVDIDKGRFDILAERNNGKISDVRRLSGAESTSFILLSLLALLPFIPANRRANLLILDEMEIGLDRVTRDKFVTDFLPKLNEIIAHIVLITPQSSEDFYIPNAKEFIIEKRKGISKLISS